jgi:hypothetical protein
MKKIYLFVLLLTLQKTILAQSFPDSAVVAASLEFENASLFKKIFLGSNYRKEWATPVKMPAFSLRTNEHDFTIDKMGGGHQTTSLYLIDKNGKEWVLRSVDKTVKEDLVRGLFKLPFVLNMIQDLVSTAYPYGSLSIPDLSNAAGVVVGQHQLYFVPDDPAFGEHRERMANRAFILIDLHPTGESELKTNETIEKLRESNDYLMDQREFLKSRLLDWFIADWDRHEGQLRWLQKDSVGKKWFYPLPRDRDQAFAHSEGLFVKFVGITFMPFLRGFEKKSTGIRQLSKKIDSLDDAFLNRLEKNNWEEIIKNFQNNLTDSVIVSAIKKQPEEIYSIRGQRIIEKLKSRRDGLLKNALKYYSFLAREVTVKSSREAEFFKVNNYPDKTQVTVYDYSNEDTTQLIYSRTFYPSETRTIYILEDGADKILQEGEPNKIKVVIKNADNKTQTAFQKNE